jgi:hypothetical protein
MNIPLSVEGTGFATVSMATGSAKPFEVKAGNRVVKNIAFVSE